MRPRHLLLAPIAIAALSGCLDFTGARTGGSPCGNNQYGDGIVTLPDTGIEAGHELQVTFIQHELSGELSEVVIQFTAPGASVVDTNAVPRVRLLNEAGLVFVDTLGNNAGRPTWYVLKWIKDAPTRNALYDAFANQTLWLELWKQGASSLGTRVRVDIKDYGIYPPATCL